MIPEEELFKLEKQRSRGEIAETLVEAAEEIRAGTVHLESATDDQQITIPETPRFEIELERLIDSETGEERYELEYELRWTK